MISISLERALVNWRDVTPQTNKQTGHCDRITDTIVVNTLKKGACVLVDYVDYVECFKLTMVLEPDSITICSLMQTVTV